MRFAAALLVAAAPALAWGADQRVMVEDALGRPLASAVVYLSSPSLPPAAAPAPAIIDQKNRQFAPRITVVQTGTSVSFPNSDQVRHSVYSFSRPKVFTLKLYAGKPASPVVFDKPGPVVLGCNIHDEMAAWLLVVDTPVFGTTDSGGQFVFHGLKPGEYQLYAWYPGLESAAGPQAVTIGTQEATPRRVHLDARPIGEGAQ